MSEVQLNKFTAQTETSSATVKNGPWQVQRS